MKRVLCNSIWLLIMLLLLVPNSVDAKVHVTGDATKVSKECLDYMDDLDKSLALKEKYGLDVTLSDNQYQIVLNVDSMDDSVKKPSFLKNVQFKVSRILGYDTRGDNVLASLDESDENAINSYINNDNKILSSKNRTLVLNKNKINKPLFKVIVQPVGFFDSELIKTCGKDTTFDVELSAESGMIIQAISEDDFPGHADKVTLEQNQSNVSTKQIIDCKGNGYTSWDKSSFDYKFCEAREKARNNKVTNTNQSVKCDVKDKITYGDDYYVNKSYFMKTDITMGKELIYKNHYTCDDISTYSGGRCTIKCEEVVTVEYGPPAAQKAGFCFEYKVRVTSRVSCGVVSYPTPPREESICTPVPMCTIPGTNIWHHQGGPSEDFDSCVMKCDGGAYSDRCSNQCYKQVYGKTIVRNTTGSEITFADTLDSSNRSSSAKKTATGDLRYKCYDNGQIYWDGKQNIVKGSYRNRSGVYDSRWHRSNAWDFADKANYDCVSNTGIPRRCGCGETCTWTIGSCRYGTVNGRTVVQGYMNPGEARAAYNENANEYKKEVAACEAAASCTESTTEFTIGTTVGDKTYTFPQKLGKDTFTRKDNTITHTFESDQTSIIKNSNIGCYNPSEKKPANLEYGAAWTFPGTYIKLKTGEISYAPHNDKSWDYRSELFCLPLNAPDTVNSKWWDYYYTKNAGITNRNYSFEGLTCKEGCGFTKRETISESDIEKWNIFAKTVNFGHYKWNIDIKCFYASKKPTPPTPPTPDPDSEPVRIRSVDLANLFPDPNGSEIKSSDDFGRDRGFNWTEYANNTKNSNYISYPELYGKAVQKKETSGHSVYDDDSEIDYYIHLTRRNISNIKALSNDSNNFVLFDGGKSELRVEKDSAPHYKSNFIRDIKYSTMVLHPSDAAISCNNIIDRTRCDTSLSGS